VKNGQTRDAIARIILESGHSVATLDSLENLLEFLSEHKSRLVILDADLCGGYCLETIEQIRSVSPLSVVALVVGWWDERVTEIFGRHKHFLYRPLRHRQVQDLLIRVFSQAVALSASR
jgi:DNA-binding NtrC family response regulator